MITIEQITSQDDIEATRDLVRALTDWAISLDPDTKDAPTFTNLESELAALPGKFVPPTGGFLLARDEGEAVGCGALINHGDENFEITRGMRIAQLIVAPVVQVAVEEVEELTSSERGSGGFGSTGS